MDSVMSAFDPEQTSAANFAVTHNAAFLIRTKASFVTPSTAKSLPSGSSKWLVIALAITSHFDDPLGNDFAVEGVTKLALVRIRNAALCVTAKLAADVCSGSKADITLSIGHVRFTPQSGHWLL